MVSFKSFITAAVLSGIASALPRPDSAVGMEVAVSAPNGTPVTDAGELASQSSIEAAQASPTANMGMNDMGMSSMGMNDMGMSSMGMNDMGMSSMGMNDMGMSSMDMGMTETVMSTDAQPTMYGGQPPSNPQGGQYSNGNQYGYNSGQGQQPPQGDDWAATSSASAMAGYSTPSYGSGNSNWGGSGYDSCVNQCIATYGAPAATYAPTQTSGQMGSTGTGATHTIIVAPSQGVLRYVPFAVNASVGDTIKFMWNADQHTVTHSSALAPCNKSSEDPFTSGVQNKSFVFTQVVNDTSPTFFYCGVTGHCQKGMFGIINPPSNSNGGSSVSGMMQTVGQSNPDVAAYASYTGSQTQGNDFATNWGGNIDTKDMPDWAMSSVMENVLYTRTFLAANKEVVTNGGTVDLSSADHTPLVIPADFAAAINNAAPAPASASGATLGSQNTATDAAPSSPISNAGASAGTTSGAISLSSSRILVGAAVVVATFFAL